MFTGRLITEKHGKPNVTADKVLTAVIERKLKYNAIKSKIKTEQATNYYNHDETS